MLQVNLHLERVHSSSVDSMSGSYSLDEHHLAGNLMHDSLMPSKLLAQLHLSCQTCQHRILFEKYELWGEL